MPHHAPHRIATAARDRAKRRIQTSTLAAGMIATAGLGALVGVMGYQAAHVSSTASGSAATPTTAASTPAISSSPSATSTQSTSTRATATATATATTVAPATATVVRATTGGS